MVVGTYIGHAMAAELLGETVLMHVHQDVDAMVRGQLRLLLHDIQKGLIVLPSSGLRASPVMAQPHDIQPQVMHVLHVLLAKRRNTRHPLHWPIPRRLFHDDIGAVEEARAPELIDYLVRGLVDPAYTRHAGMGRVPASGILTHHAGQGAD